MSTGRQAVLGPQMILQAAALNRMPELPALHHRVATSEIQWQLRSTDRQTEMELGDGMRGEGSALGRRLLTLG